MGVDRYQVTEANWNYIQKEEESHTSLTGVSTNISSTLVKEVTENVGNDIYQNSWFRALNDIQNSENFMCELDNIYWEVKYRLQAKTGKFISSPPLKNREIIYKFDLGPSMPDTYFVEVRFNFYSDEITLSIGQNL
tara:strand:+ start:42 stop:449 length:408 start_codon:yes stop_codon:yes gene_type:complete